MIARPLPGKAGEKEEKMETYEFNGILVSECVVHLGVLHDILPLMRPMGTELVAKSDVIFDVVSADSTHAELLLWHSGMHKYLHFAYIDLSSILTDTEFHFYDLTSCYGFWKYVIPKMLPVVQDCREIVGGSVNE